MGSAGDRGDPGGQCWCDPVGRSLVSSLFGLSWKVPHLFAELLPGPGVELTPRAAKGKA